MVPAVQISAVHAHYEDLHILGYGIEHRSPELLDALTSYRADRAARADRMRDALKELGLAVEEQVLDRQVGSGASIGRRILPGRCSSIPRMPSGCQLRGWKDPNSVACNTDRARAQLSLWDIHDSA